jgi:GrpB-like predicted nucleotidyltransferase (UPF0157 family)
MLILEYDPQWPINFEIIKSELTSFLVDTPIQIEHIGSTSISNCAAKGIIDIDIIYNDDVDFVGIKEALTNNGYYHNGDQGIRGREVFKRNGEPYSEVLDNITHHLYVCKWDNVELLRHLHFRDYLRKNEVAKDFYVSQKRKIAQELNQDKSAYAELKQLKVNSFIDYVIELERMKAKKE